MRAPVHAKQKISNRHHLKKAYGLEQHRQDNANRRQYRDTRTDKQKRAHHFFYGLACALFQPDFTQRPQRAQNRHTQHRDQLCGKIYRLQITQMLGCLLYSRIRLTDGRVPGSDIFYFVDYQAQFSLTHCLVGGRHVCLNYMIHDGTLH